VSSWDSEPITPEFLERPVDVIAPDLLGCLLEQTLGTERITLSITEVEAYDAATDPASHAYRGRTARNAVMFGPPGHAYVYFIYGMHHALNIVCGPEGHASAVLVRAGRIIHGIDTARAHVTTRITDARIASGPGRLTRSMAIDLTLNGVDLRAATSGLTLRRGTPVHHGATRTGPRVGVTKAADRPWRFWIDGDPAVSQYRPYPPRRRGTVEPVRATRS
jgi:DNA-3-methyladenine glycosylase